MAMDGIDPGLAMLATQNRDGGMFGNNGMGFVLGLLLGNRGGLFRQ